MFVRVDARIFSTEKRNCIQCGKEFVVFCHATKKNCGIECAAAGRRGCTISQKHKQRISETRKRDWANGKVYANVTAARTKWYDHTKPSGEKIRLQGTWEVLYAKYLDDNNVNYVAHKGAIWYVRSSDNTRRVYLPDFLLTDTDEYVDVKNDYAFKIEKQKFLDIRACNPKLKLKIIKRSDLVQLGLL